jgi:hypothetical protein
MEKSPNPPLCYPLTIRGSIGAASFEYTTGLTLSALTEEKNCNLLS